jgi:glycosyltransferase involved in cell wall biosynthesis
VRLAWVGPTPSDDSGATYAETVWLRALCGRGVEIDFFLAASEDEIPNSLQQLPNLRFVLRPPHWEWGRWYSRSQLSSFATGMLARLTAQFRLAPTIADEHRRRHYDAVYQFSQPELTALRRVRKRLPPIIVHPGTHAAGELRWHRAEQSLARRCERTSRYLLVRSILRGRAAVQRADLRVAAGVIAPSRHFGDHLARDYGVPGERIHVVPHAVDLDRFTPGSGNGRGNPSTLLFVSRMSVRKGVEQVVALSHRLNDLADQVRVLALGGDTLWSDYRCLLRDLNPDVGSYRGHLQRGELTTHLRTAVGLVQPSLYEPFGLTVAEALASGTPVVASDEVGAGEGIDPTCCRRFPAGDLDAFEAAVRGLLTDMSSPRADEVRRVARSEAERQYAPSVAGTQLVAAIEAICASGTGPAARRAAPQSG